MIKRPKNTAGLSLRKFKRKNKSSAKVKKVYIYVGVSFLVFLLIFIGGKAWWQNSQTALDPNDKSKVNFVIRKGESVSSVSGRLGEQGLVKSPFFFKIFLVSSGLAKKIQAGTFSLSPSMSPKEISNLFIKGTNDQWVTVIEGLRQEQIGALLIKNGFAINPQEWQERVKREGLEGKLFPDSYLFPKDANLETILKIIEKNFQKKIVNGLDKEIKESELEFTEVLTLASILEREARSEIDKRIISGILIKRLENDWPLQVDASVQYALANANCRDLYDLNCDWWPKKLGKEDLKIKSPFNSYIHQGLPPAPICNPGFSSIKAALAPQESPYWFYISDLEGKMHYAKTDEEHTQNISRYLLK